MTTRRNFAAAVLALSAVFAVSMLWRSAGDQRPSTEPASNAPNREAELSDAADGSAIDLNVGVATSNIGVSDERPSADSGALSDSERLWAGTDPQSVDRRRRSNPLLWWPQSPALTESLIYSALLPVLPDIISLDLIECDETQCELLFLTKDESGGFPQDPSGALRLSAEIRRISESEELSQLGIGGKTYGNQEGPDGVTRAYLRLESYGQVPNNPTVTDEDLVGAADRFQSLDLGARPVILGTYQGLDVILSDQCAYGCPGDSEIVIFFNVPPHSNCEEIGGIEQSLPWVTNSGVSTFVACIPAIVMSPGAK